MKNIFYLPENFEQYDFVVEKLRLDLKELIRGAVPSKEIVEYINDLKGQLTRLDRGDRSMLFLMLGSPESFPIEERVMYVYTPTYIATAIVSYAFQHYPEVQHITDVELILNDLLVACIGRNFTGHGFDNNDAIIDALTILVEGDITHFIDSNEDINPDFVEVFNSQIRYIINRVAKGLENDCFGYSPIEKAQLFEELVERKGYQYE